MGHGLEFWGTGISGKKRGSDGEGTRIGLIENGFKYNGIIIR